MPPTTMLVPCPPKTGHPMHIRSPTPPLPPTTKPPFLPNPNLKVRIYEFAYCKGIFPIEATAKNLTKFATLQSLLGWTILLSIIITMGIRGTAHTTTVKRLQDLHIPTIKICKLIETSSQVGIIYPTHIMLNKQKLEEPPYHLIKLEICTKPPPPYVPINIGRKWWTNTSCQCKTIDAPFIIAMMPIYDASYEPKVIWTKLVRYG